MSAGNTPHRAKTRRQKGTAGKCRTWDRYPVIPAEPEAGYSRKELFELWQNFRGQRDEVKVMMDFSLLDKPRAEQLIREFTQELTDTPEITAPILPTFPRAQHDLSDFMW